MNNLNEQISEVDTIDKRQQAELDEDLKFQVNEIDNLKLHSSSSKEYN